MDIDIVEMWHAMNPIVKAVVVILTIQGVWGVTITIDRLLMLFMSKRRSKKFASEVSTPMERGDAMGALKVADEAQKKSHLARFIYEGIKVFEDNLALGMGRDRAAMFTQRNLERTGENLSADLNKGLSVLATTGSTAPFIGLLGTVFGILGAFKVIGQDGGGGLSTIGPLIGEALYVTGYGLMVAIPSVMLFNWLSGLIGKYESGLANAGSELVDQLEAGAIGGGVAGVDLDSTGGGEIAPAPAE
ncbi:MAG: MotA/TolQ/ExbB proton channel family protein [Polyangiales bacterium]